MKLPACILLAALAVLSARGAETGPRIASGGGTITEIIYALEAQSLLVAADTSSTYPAEAQKLPKIGYARLLSAEGILSVHPTLLLINDDAGPPEVLEQIEKAGVKVVRFANQHTPEAAIDRILKIGELVGQSAAAEKLAASVRADLDSAKANPVHPKVLFIYTHGGGMMNVSGQDTAADAMIALAGGVNAVTGYQGYKPLTVESAVAAAPDFILLTTSGLAASGGVQELLKQPGLALTPAGRNGKVIAIDDLALLGFGPRLGQAVKELGEKLHPQTTAMTGP